MCTVGDCDFAIVYHQCTSTDHLSLSSFLTVHHVKGRGVSFVLFEKCACPQQPPNILEVAASSTASMQRPGRGGYSD